MNNIAINTYGLIIYPSKYKYLIIATVYYSDVYISLVDSELDKLSNYYVISYCYSVLGGVY